MSDALLFWLGAGLLTAIAVVALLRPLFRPRGAMPKRTLYDLAVYRDQLAEVERDVARGVLNAEQAAAARLEIERRILSTATDDPTDGKPAAQGVQAKGVRWTAAAIAICLPVVALGLYLHLGTPGLLSSTPRTATGPAVPQEGGPGDMEALVEQLARRMAEAPDDPRGWLLLARSYATLGRYQDSAAAYAAAIAHGAAEGPEGAEVQSAYGEVLTAAANGQITVAAQGAFEAALVKDPKDPRARFYLALAEAQKGRVEKALEAWVVLEAEAPPDAPWRATVTAQIEQAAAELGLDPPKLPGRRPPPPAAAVPPGPSEEDAAAAADMTPAERDAFIRAMVDRLAARLAEEPNDLDGWKRLAESYSVLGEAAKAEAAWSRAAALAPDDVRVQLAYAQAIYQARTDEGPLPPAFARAVEKVRALDPTNALGLYLAGIAASEAGDQAGARRLWQELAARLPEGSPERIELEARIAALPEP